jgi:hypothetical protein
MRPLQKKQKKQKNKQKKTTTNKKKGGGSSCLLISTSLCKGRASIYGFQSFQKKKREDILSVSTFLYKFTTQS